MGEKELYSETVIPSGELSLILRNVFKTLFQSNNCTFSLLYLCFPEEFPKGVSRRLFPLIFL